MNIKKKKILIAEDNLALAAVLNFNLSNSGYQVIVANNGTRAWECAQSELFDLVITDHQMPGMSGVELCQNIRKLPRYAATPIIMLTAKSLELDAEILGEQLRIQEVVAKPFSPMEMVNKVHSIFDLNSNPSNSGPHVALQFDLVERNH